MSSSGSGATVQTPEKDSPSAVRSDSHAESSTVAASTAVSSRTPDVRGIATPGYMHCDRNDTARKAVGTPDYLAPESILGTNQDSMVDWVSVLGYLYRGML